MGLTDFAVVKVQGPTCRLASLAATLPDVVRDELWGHVLGVAIGPYVLADAIPRWLKAEHGVTVTAPITGPMIERHRSGKCQGCAR